MWMCVCAHSFHQREQTNKRSTHHNKYEIKKQNKIRIKHMQNRLNGEYKYSSLDRLFESIKTVHAHRQTDRSPTRECVCAMWTEKENINNLMISNPNWVAALNERTNETKTEWTKWINPGAPPLNAKGKGCIVILFGNLFYCSYAVCSPFLDDCILLRINLYSALIGTVSEKSPYGTHTHKFISHSWRFNFKPHASFVCFCICIEIQFYSSRLCMATTATARNRIMVVIERGRAFILWPLQTLVASCKNARSINKKYRVCTQITGNTAWHTSIWIASSERMEINGHRSNRVWCQCILIYNIDHTSANCLHVSLHAD